MGITRARSTKRSWWLTLYYNPSRQSTYIAVIWNSRTPYPNAHWPILERTSPSRSVFDLINRANHGPKTSPHKKGKYAAPDDCCWVAWKTIRNVDESRRRDSNLSVRQDDRLRRSRVLLLQRFIRKVADDVCSNDSGLTNRLPKLLLLGPVYNVASGKH